MPIPLLLPILLAGAGAAATRRKAAPGSSSSAPPTGPKARGLGGLVIEGDAMPAGVGLECLYLGLLAPLGAAGGGGELVQLSGSSAPSKQGRAGLVIGLRPNPGEEARLAATLQRVIPGLGAFALPPGGDRDYWIVGFRDVRAALDAVRAAEAAGHHVETTTDDAGNVLVNVDDDPEPEFVFTLADLSELEREPI